ncbi:hypothetical protein AN5475.2 [Aspergillus nidulans FGSC A4]|uniref:PKS-like enzyme, putative (JCVI) n=1 Tax=Emericella nidulans (strain FGSC A4 / ATCC 38163 / CBS 112.46 / NRRL 194 / M139) TaxID=227321 RepID=Q5B1V5_EMENI|nr:hypothetical protein [Aspergillus nidulans FGSC A4]EAA62635.1 hypothetical protein AN5475.2 [Aspergillus nidulans FGSC A4]CBF81841.1 TPA: PKS-like enzyme, putative (JCVI) [Aspergillus nidulans FGSC A4]|eukprot:XP_663079.1 hypothetical protein AN5475.2 [Aspergillus nidulans FGSC A4]
MGSGRGRVPTNRYNIDAFVGPKGKAGHSCTEHGYFLEDIDLATIDSSFWSMSGKEVEWMDPQQRLMLEGAYECLESSGTTSYKGKDIGCYIGVFGEDWLDIQAKVSHNSDGKTAGLSFPSPKSHEDLIRRSHELAGIEYLSKPAIIECHGTGTAVGDPLEACAAAQVKTDLGHSEGASGLSSVLKMVLVLEHQTIPLNLNFTTPNPKIPFDSARRRGSCGMPVMAQQQA